MLTIDLLRDFGANVEEGLGRCMNNEKFYLQMVGMTLNEKSFDKLAAAVASGDKKIAFEAAHALKGITGNVALTPLYEQLSEMTELLRADKDADYPAYAARILELRDTLLKA